MKEMKDCSSCLHSKICIYVQHFHMLNNIGNVEFSCKFHLSSTGKTIDEPKKEQDPKYSALSVDELSKMVSAEESKEAEDTKIDFKDKICEICGENPAVDICSSCGKYICNKCGEFEDEIDLTTGLSEERFVCYGCQD